MIYNGTSTSSEPAHTGSWDAWLHVDTAEATTTTKYDTLKLDILNSSGTVLSTPGASTTRR